MEAKTPWLPGAALVALLAIVILAVIAISAGSHRDEEHLPGGPSRDGDQILVVRLIGEDPT
ncbi:MAG: hypothetical protein WEB00_14855 [Dehalococcoidia bacterium]